jgi:hypothetical protein
MSDMFAAIEEEESDEPKRICYFDLETQNVYWGRVYRT